MGAAREVTGSCHLIHIGSKTIMLDCGLFQGRRAITYAKNKQLPLPVDQLDAVILSHAHIDHSGRLPMLTREGFRGTIWATAATRDLCAVMLADSAHIQDQDAKFLARKNREVSAPLYTISDATCVTKLIVGVPYGKTYDVMPGVTVCFEDAGHILGSASIVLDCNQRDKHVRIVFSGDIGRWGLPIIRDPQPPVSVDVLIMESTYGNRDHESVPNTRARLARIVTETASRSGRILIPAFAVGRTQELVYELHVLARSGRIPRLPIYIDSPLAIDATTVFGMHPEVFDSTEDLIQQVHQLFEFPMLAYTRETKASKALAGVKGPMIIIAASGMAEAGRILHHLRHGASDPNNTILIVGFQAEHTLGRRIVERAPVIKIFGEEIPLRARVEVLNGFSAHADRTELCRWIDTVRNSSPTLGPVYLVHGEEKAQDALAGTLAEHGYTNVQCPTHGMRVSV